VCLCGEHGLSLWIENAETCVLFDTGQGLALPHNARALNVDLDSADAVLSHGHYDHTGGTFFLDAQGTLPDPMEDGQTMWIETTDGPVVLLGCAHSLFCLALFGVSLLNVRRRWIA